MDDQQNNQNQNNQVPLNQEPPIYSEPPQTEIPTEPQPETPIEPIPEMPSEPSLPPQPQSEPEPEMQPEPNLPEPEQSEPEQEQIPQSEPINETQSDSVDDAAAKYQQILNEYAASQKQSEPEPQSEPESPLQPESNFEPEQSPFEPEIQSEPELPPTAESEYQTPVDEVPPQTNIFKTLFIIMLFINIIIFSVAALIYYKTNQNKDTSDLPQPTPSPSSMTCPLNGKEYKVGEYFTSEDGCNTCSCTDVGEVVCTEKACAITPTVSSATKSATKPTVTPTKPATTSSATTTWKTYTNKTTNYSINYSDKWTFREFPGTGTGAGFRLLTSANDPTNEFININKMERDPNHLKTVFSEYVKIAATFEIENYTSLATIKKITTSTGLVGYETTWNIITLDGKKEISLPITYFDTKDSKGNTVQVTLNDKNYLDDYNKMILTFKFN